MSYSFFLKISIKIKLEIKFKMLNDIIKNNVLNNLLETIEFLVNGFDIRNSAVFSPSSLERIKDDNNME